MKRSLLTLIAAVLVTSAAGAAEPPKYYLKTDGTVEARLEKVESSVGDIKDELAQLRARLARLEGAADPIPPRAAEPAPKAPDVSAATVAKPVKTSFSGHTHTCSRGHTWDHTMDGGSHQCPTCGEVQTVIDSPGRVMRVASTAQTFGSPCGPNGCSAQATYSYRRAGIFGGGGLFGWRNR